MQVGVGYGPTARIGQRYQRTFATLYEPPPSLRRCILRVVTSGPRRRLCTQLHSKWCRRANKARVRIKATLLPETMSTVRPSETWRRRRRQEGWLQDGKGEWHL